MKSMLWSFLFLILMLIGTGVAGAETVTYIFVEQGGASGTSWILADPNGYLTVPSGNVINLVQTATNVILAGPMTGPEDFGPLTDISVVSPAAEPDSYGIGMGTSSFTLVPLFILKADFTTPGTYELAAPAELQGNFPADQGTLTITATRNHVPRHYCFLDYGVV